ncbi:hypothetical protein HUS23_12465 [Ectothiorhodospiraceae bacterium 2226]|nr:hypothetical protein HUS23_12465 [Ectothiorhodospiraceae bacterium 2226]
MAEPTVEKRLQRKFIVMTADEDMQARLQRHIEPGWEMVVTTDLSDLGDWNDILLYRFLLIDLDEVDAFDPLDVIGMIRRELMLNIAVFCFGGDEVIRDEMRLARADRFFEREEMVERLPEFLRQYGWGG